MNLNYDYKYQWNNGYDVMTERSKWVESQRKGFSDKTHASSVNGSRKAKKWIRNHH